MLSLFVEIIVPFFIVIPGAIGFVLALPILVFYSLFVRSRLRRQLHEGIALSIGLLSTLLVMSLYAWQIISLEYAITIPSSKDWEIRQKHENEAVQEAWRHTIIPRAFQKSCYSTEEMVCQLAEGYSLGIWDWRINAEDLPWLSGVIAGITTAMTVWLRFSSIMQRANPSSVHSTP